MESLTFAALVVLPVLMIVAGLYDLTTMKIPNWISLALLAAGCLWMGLTGSALFLLHSALVGGSFCLALLTLRRVVPPYPGFPTWMSRLLEPKGDVPYGVALAGGALMAFPNSSLVTAFVGG